MEKMTSPQSSVSTISRIGLLTNPLSGRNRRRPESLSALLDEYPEVIRQDASTFEEIHETLRYFADLGIDILVVHGGDGTVQAVLTIICHETTPFTAPPQLMVLKGGTTNMIAGDVGIGGSQTKALKRLLQWARTGKGCIARIQRPVLRLLMPGHGPKYGMFFGAGCITQATRYYHQRLHNNVLRGFPGICMTISRFLWALIRKRKTFSGLTPMTISVNGQPAARDIYILFFASTLEQLFFGLNPFWGNESGPLRCTAITSRARYLPWILPFLARGCMTRIGTIKNGYCSNNCHEVDMYVADSVVLDGEIYTLRSSSRQPTVLQYGGNSTFIRI